MATKETVPAPEESVAAAVTASRAADEKQGSDLAVLDVGGLLALVDLFVLVSARTDRQLKAIAEAIEEAMRREHDRRPIRREGTPDSGWYLLDYGDVVCHLFDEERRSYFALERLWADVPQLEPLSGEQLDDAVSAASTAR